jgi:hypothetical protein
VGFGCTFPAIEAYQCGDCYLEGSWVSYGYCSPLLATYKDSYRSNPIVRVSGGRVVDWVYLSIDCLILTNTDVFINWMKVQVNHIHWAACQLNPFNTASVYWTAADDKSNYQYNLMLKMIQKARGFEVPAPRNYAVLDFDSRQKTFSLSFNIWSESLNPALLAAS